MRNNRQILSIIAVCGLMTLLIGCRSSKKATKDDTDVTTSATAVQTVKPNENTVVTRVLAQRQDVKGLRSKVSVKLSYNGRSASASGQLKMKRDEIIQVAIYALGIMEVGRLEMTPQHLLVLDRVNKQYLQIAWTDVPELAQAGIDFSTFQALFWNEVFIPGKNLPAVADFNVKEGSSTLQLTPKASRANTKAVTVDFLVETAKALLKQTNVAPTNGKNGMKFVCAYDDWTTLAQKSFPRQMNLHMDASNKKYDLAINASSLQADESMGNLSTKVSTGYKRVTLDQIMNMLAQ